ncbi:sulfatase-like hydrolase/transferase [Paenibacillus endoradicis]|uniref:sulfatase-like hydrolase/transferase n=1 Tax=Paenibacillus endoradicis TaxID=2972487 RepID=UPI002159184E|nr:sulfatase-like hydrolase/transferase [Paenibacillus endoradicis]MCR8660536.1 sulfatase-like hydrolase/transferase [Paenibacillus endoradicis]
MMMSEKYETRLQKLIEQYDFKFDKTLNYYFRFKMQQLLLNELKHERVAIWGAGGFTFSLFSNIRKIPECIISVIDNDPDKTDTYFITLPVKNIASLLKDQITTIVLSTEISNGVIKEQIENEFPNRFKIIDPIEILRFINIVEEPNIYKQEKGFIGINALKNDYLHNKDHLDNEQKVNLLRDLVAWYLVYRDFEHAFRYLDEMIQLSPFHKSIKEFKNKIQDMLVEIKQIIKSSTIQRKFMFMIDGMRYEDMVSDDFTAVKQLRDKSAVYSNLFASSTYTKACVISMFQEDYILDTSILEINEFDLDRSRFINYLWDEGYTFVHNFTVEPLVTQSKNKQLKYFVHPEEEYRSYQEHYLATPYYIWKLLLYLCDERSDKEFYFVHLHEAHAPYMSTHMNGEINPAFFFMKYDDPKVKKNPEKIKDQYTDSVAYINRQLTNLFDFLGNHTMIFCSDHGGNIKAGRTPGHTLTYDEDVIHVPLVICSDQTSPEKNDDLLSMHELNDILLSHLKNNKVYHAEHTHVEIQRDRLVDGTFTNSALTPFIKDYIPASICLRTNQLKYIVNELGVEKLYALPDEKTNVVEDNQYMEQLNYLRQSIKRYQNFKVSY